MKVTVDIKNCNECPHYEVYDGEEYHFGAQHVCSKTGKTLAWGGSVDFGHPYPVIRIPKDCPVKKSKSS